MLCRIRILLGPPDLREAACRCGRRKLPDNRGPQINGAVLHGRRRTCSSPIAPGHAGCESKCSSRACAYLRLVPSSSRSPAIVTEPARVADRDHLPLRGLGERLRVVVERRA